MPTGENGLSYVGFGTDGTVWTSLGAYAASLRPSGGQRNIGAFQNFDDEYPTVVTPGKMEPYEFTLRLLYTYGTTEPYAMLRALHLAGSQVYLRWSYNAATASYYKAQGYMRDVPLPEADSESATPLAVDVVFRPATITPVGSVT